MRGVDGVLPVKTRMLAIMACGELRILWLPCLGKSGGLCLVSLSRGYMRSLWLVVERPATFVIIEGVSKNCLGVCRHASVMDTFAHDLIRLLPSSLASRTEVVTGACRRFPDLLKMCS